MPSAVAAASRASLLHNSLCTPDDDAGQIPATCRRAFGPVLTGPKLDFQTIVRAIHRCQLYRAGRRGQAEGRAPSPAQGAEELVPGSDSVAMVPAPTVR